MEEEDFLAQQRESWQRTIAGKGGTCPCCERFGKIYKRSINTTMAYSLSWLVFTAPKDKLGWTDVPRFGPRMVVRSNQLPTLRWWGLVERNDEAAKVLDLKHVGLWRPTIKGVRFSNNQMAVPKYVFHYNDEVIRFSEEVMHIAGCGGRFSYSATMAPAE